MDDGITRILVVGCGQMAQGHVRDMLREPEKNKIVAVCEPSTAAYQAIREVFIAAGQPPPPNQPDLSRVLRDYAGQLDVAFIVTPHVYHYQQATASLEAGLDVLLEKPMVVSVAEATDLLATRNRTGRLLVVAFNGSLSPRIRQAAAWLRSGEFGTIKSITATIWENWSEKYTGHWKQDYAVSAGGFMFDTGAHMLNTVADLAGEDFIEVAAWLDLAGRPVDIFGVTIGRLASGAMVTMQACGDTIRSCNSDIRVFCSEAIVRTGAWGEFLELQRNGEPVLRPIELTDPRSPWEQFLSVRRKEIANPSPPEIGLRMAKLWDAIQISSRLGGQPVSIE